MRFENSKLKTKYNTYRNYLEARCEALPRQIEKKFGNVECYHNSSSCYGMSNYINIEVNDQDGNYLDSFEIRISDHNPTGSGEHCDEYIYINGKEWLDIKKGVFKCIKNKLKEF